VESDGSLDLNHFAENLTAIKIMYYIINGGDDMSFSDTSFI
jgi:hypothetical protein